MFAFRLAHRERRAFGHMAGSAVAAWLRPTGLHPDRRPLTGDPPRKMRKLWGDYKIRKRRVWDFKRNVKINSKHDGGNVIILLGLARVVVGVATA